MTVELAASRYGKSGIRLVTVERDGARHALRDLEVEIRFEGDYLAAHRDGDNREVLPTDTRKNTVYALAGRGPVGPAEGYALRLARHFLDGPEPPSRVVVAVAERHWSRVADGGRGHDHAFEAGGGERRTARVAVGRDSGDVEVVSGVRGLELLKTTRSGFSDFRRDPYTTLPDTDDRIFSTTVEGEWRWAAEPDPAGCDAAWEAVRRALVATFAGHDSRSAQHTLYAMGEAALAAVPGIEEIRLVLPNQHKILVDLARFGIENPNRVFVATSEPYGVIEGTVRRSS
jgi:urate oxidase